MTERPIITSLYLLPALDAALAAEASDVHLAAGCAPMMRVAGNLKPALDAEPMEAEQIMALLRDARGDAWDDNCPEGTELRFMHTHGSGARLRIVAQASERHPRLSIRIIPSAPRTAEEIALPDALMPLLSSQKGLIVISGTSGCGASTTLAALIDAINSQHARHILTLESPVEYWHSAKRSLVTHLDIPQGSHAAVAATITEALQSLHHRDVDVIAIADISHPDVLAAALAAAEAGHLVLGVMRTPTAQRTIERILDGANPDARERIRSMLASNIRAILCQTLLPHKESGGQVAAYELLIGNSAIRTLIREEKTAQIFGMMQMGQALGMSTLKDALIRLLHEGKVSEESVKSILLQHTEDEANGMVVTERKVTRL